MSVKDFLKINKRGAQNKVREGVNIFQKLLNGPPLILDPRVMDLLPKGDSLGRSTPKLFDFHYKFIFSYFPEEIGEKSNSLMR